MKALASRERGTSRLVVLATSGWIATAAFGCGDGAPSPTGPSSEGPVTVVIAPANAVPVADPDFPFAAGFTVQVFERTGEEGAEILEIVVTLENEVTYTQEQVRLAAGATRVPALGSLEIPLAIGLTMNGVTAEVIVRVLTDGGDRFDALGRLVVVPAQGP